MTLCECYTLNENKYNKYNKDLYAGRFLLYLF